MAPPAVAPAVADLERMDRETFAATLAAVVEHSPWVAAAAWERRPFGSRAGVALAFEAAIRTAPEDQRLQVLLAHPELAGREARDGRLTDASASEQASARLDRLAPEELAALQALNLAYRERFGFPFISCVREHSVASLLAWGAARLTREREAEVTTALAEVGKIAGLRLQDLVAP